MRKFGLWGLLFDTAGPELWSKYILRNLSVLGIHFKWNFVLIANLQIALNKIDSESVYLLKYLLKTGFPIDKIIQNCRKIPVKEIIF